MHKALIDQVSDYITILLTQVTNIPSSSSLHASSNSDLFQPRTDRRIDDCILCHHISCMESPTDRTETHAVVDSNIQAPSEVFSFSHRVLTM